MFYRGITPEFLLGHGINPDGLLFGPRFLPYNPNLKQFSRDLRKGYQLAEVKLWKCLRAKNMGYCNQLNLVIEIDGFSHFSAEAQERDKERDRQMHAIGLRVVRVNYSEVRKDAERVAKWIIEQVEGEKLEELGVS